MKPHPISSPILFLLCTLVGVSLFSFELSFVLKQPLTYVLLLSSGLMFVEKYRPFKSVIHTLKQYKKLFIFLISTIIVFLLFGKNLEAEWGPIDDHEIMVYLGTDQQLSFLEIPRQLSNSEVGSPGTATRYRPVYHTLRLLETSLWGNNPHLWYAFRLLLLIVSIVILWHLLSKGIGVIPSGSLILYILTYQMWADMFARLGPSETYSVFGIAIYAWGVVSILQSVWKNVSLSPLAVVAWTAGTIICVGAKENFLLLLVPNIGLVGLLVLKNKCGLFECVNFVVSLCITIFIAGAIGMATLRAGQDIYGSTVSAQSRATILVTGLKHRQSKEILLAIVGGLSILLLQMKLSYPRVSYQKTFLFIAALISYELIFLSQFVFYNADWPNGSRYDFPGILIIPLFYLTLFVYFVDLLTQHDVKSDVVKGLQYGALIGLIFLTVMRGFVGIQVRVADNVHTTSVFTGRIKAISTQLKKDPSVPVVVESGGPWDFEPVYSYEKFLRAYGVTNPMHLRLHNYSPETVAPGLEKELATSLYTIQMSGNAAYEPLPENLEKCYSLLLTAAPSSTCTPL